MISDLVTTKEGGVTALFREIWFVDFEFRADPGDHPWPVCMVAQEVKTGRVMRLWRNELLALKRAPFEVGTDALFVAYYSSAEFGCFLELGWPLPENVLDLYVEHRVETNGEKTPCGDSLLGALSQRGLGHIDAGQKEEMRRLIVDQRHWTDNEKRKILEYCASDVNGNAALFSKMAPSIDWPRALLRGRYMKAVARMERTGVPIDADLYQALTSNWASLKEELIAVENRAKQALSPSEALLKAPERQGPRLPVTVRIVETTCLLKTRRWDPVSGSER